MVAHVRRRRPRPKAARRGVPASTRGQPRARAPRRAARSVPAGHEPPSPVARPRHRRPHPHPRPTCSTARPPKRVDRRTSCAQARRRVVHRPPPRRRGPCGVLYVGVCVCQRRPIRGQEPRTPPAGGGGWVGRRDTLGTGGGRARAVIAASGAHVPRGTNGPGANGRQLIASDEPILAQCPR